MDRRERMDDPVEEQRAALEGKQAEIHTAMPGIIESFDPDAMTVTVQPAIRAKVEGRDGDLVPADLPLLVDVPVVFPGGGGFTLTFPVTKGDECLIVFGERCIDGWWSSGGVQDALESRMHDLSDAFALVGVRSQPRKLDPAVDADNLQLRTDDGEAHVTMQPDYTITAKNPTAQMTLSPTGEIDLEADVRIRIKAPNIDFQGLLSMTSFDGQGSTKATIKGDIEQEGTHTSTGDQVAGGISQTKHTHTGVQTGNGSTGGPQ